MRLKLFFWIENYLFYPNTFQKIVSFILLPLSLIYCIIILFKKKLSKPHNFKIPIISIGNLIVGGSGKTPLIIELAKNKKDVCIILRGYGRVSKGLFVISNNGEILEDINISGDEAMLLAHELPNATVIVSEDRIKGIKKAKKLGCKIIFLDDAFSKYNISKFDILIRPKDEPKNFFCLPSGAYREPKCFYSLAHLQLQEGKNFKRVVSYSLNGKKIEALPSKLLLLTAISKPQRLLVYLPKNIKTIFFEDHHNFTQEEIQKVKKRFKDYKIITTKKDFVKLKKFPLKDIYLMNLKIDINYTYTNFSSMENYINSCEYMLK